MSAFGPERTSVLFHECPFLTQSGHSQTAHF